MEVWNLEIENSNGASVEEQDNEEKKINITS